ncbi:aminopeptidase P N-terminal domain-containing protein [Anatilimnocola floriformis]|uniref:aminopeptidase P N-terminal domain-containing protein n=1 Tax=Anatilimnocola floriformis TaxID=2948575 RepID=UPI0020C3442D|nr:aminopeptidase P N-terminal domain-containing protein [Anatilimnocola floriformis]
MRHEAIDSKLFTENRDRLRALLPPKSLAIVQANDVLPTNADGSFLIHPNSDLFFLSGIEQEESILLIFPDADDEKQREILFLREPNDHLKVWEGHKHTKEQGTEISGVKTIKWLSEFRGIFHRLMVEVEHVYLNTNEHRAASLAVPSRDERFVKSTRDKYPLHDYRRLAPLLHHLRVIKTPTEIELLKKAVEITKAGFLRVLSFTKPGVYENEVEAEFAHEFIRQRGKFAYNPIIAAGKNSCILHYNSNDLPCNDGDLLLLDVAASYANYNADLTRTIPISGRFTPRQRDVYDAVLRVMRASIKGAVVGKKHRDWTKESQLHMNEELLKLGLIKQEDIDKQTDDELACRKYFMHGLGHPLGLDVHDVGHLSEAFAPGWVLTVEPGIYIPDEGFGVRLENDIVVTESGPIDLMAGTPVEADEIEHLMASRHN